MATPGIEVRPLVTMTGHAEFNETFFTDVRVPKSQIVGKRGQGWFVANATLKHERGIWMPDVSWGQLFAAALGGGFTVKVLDIAYQEFRRQNRGPSAPKNSSINSSGRCSRRLTKLSESYDPSRMLTSSRSIALNPTTSVLPTTSSRACCISSDAFGPAWSSSGTKVCRSVWARTSAVPNCSIFSIVWSRAGSTGFVDRILQRAVGEVIVMTTLSLLWSSFGSLETDATSRKWITPLAKFLSRTEHTTERQRLLQYDAARSADRHARQQASDTARKTGDAEQTEQPLLG